MKNKLVSSNQVKLVILISLFFSIFYLAFFYFLDSKNNLISSYACVKKNNELDFKLYFQKPIKKKFWFLKCRSGLLLIQTRHQFNAIELETKTAEIIKLDMISPFKYQIKLKRDLLIRSIKLTPKNTFLNKVNIRIFRKPILSSLLIIYQFTFLFLIFGIGLLTITILYYFILKQKKEIIPDLFKLLIYKSVFLVLTIFVFFLLYLVDYAGYFSMFSFPDFFIKGVIFNFFLAGFLIVIFFLFMLKQKNNVLPIYLPLGISLLYFILKFPYKLRNCGDAIIWVTQLKNQEVFISFAESLSVLFNWLNKIIINLIISINPKMILNYSGKIFGVFFIFTLFYFINSLSEFSYKQKLLFFILSLTLSVNALFLGFPEFAYYPLPFLLLSLSAAKKYLNSDKRVELKYLIISTIFALIGGLFHGSGFFSFPVILLLPLLKYRSELEGDRSYLKQYILIMLTVFTTFSIYFILLVFLKHYGFHMVFNTAAGGFDSRQFISFLPVHLNFPHDVNFIEIGYFISRAWIFFISGTFVFLILLAKKSKIIYNNKSDFIFFLFGISQLVIVFFWGFDLGKRDFDLYIAPTTLIHLFLLKMLINTIPDKIKKINLLKYILCFSLASPIYFFLIQTSRVF